MGDLAGRFERAAQQVGGPSMDQRVRTFALVGVGLMKRQIQRHHAVDTGAMLNSTTVEREGNSAYLIGPTVNYAAFVALGTSRVRARPFHSDAARELRGHVGQFGFRPSDLGL